VRPDQTHGKRIWLKSHLLRDSIFPDASDSALRHLVTTGVIEKPKGGLTARQQRVSGLTIKHYFYVIDPEKLRVINGGNHRG
jgi:hypothetical protein